MNDSPAHGRANPFWDFSLALYRSPDVQQACLDLQDNGGADVNVLLYLLWHARHGRRLATADVETVVGTVEPWRRDTVVKLRDVRRALKSPPAGFDAPAAEALRTIVKKAELEAERQQQNALHALPLSALPPGPASAVRAAAAGNMAAYDGLLEGRFSQASRNVMLDALDRFMAGL